jgi:hypothetical protein
LDKVVASKNWFGESMVRKVGNGSSTFFWHSNWINDAPLSIKFPRLYSLSNHRDSKVEEFFVRDDLGGRWSLSWRRALFQWETDLLDKLLQILDFVNLTLVEDVWRWVPDPNGFFTVSSAYNLLVKELRTSDGLTPDVALVFEQIWESQAPSKVIVFSWQLLYDRIPTKCNLDHRSILSPDVSRDCVGCVGFVESSTRLFLHCSSAIAI